MPQGINVARVIAFPGARPCDDFPHMMRACQSTLSKKLWRTNVECPTLFDQPSNPRVRGKGGAKRAARGRGAAQHRVFTKTQWPEFIDMMQTTRLVPTLQLYDAVWRVVFDVMRRQWKEYDVAEYLHQALFDDVGVNNLRKMALVGKAAWGPSRLLCSGHWAGVLGTRPGTASGTQGIEALHSAWQRHLEDATACERLAKQKQCGVHACAHLATMARMAKHCVRVPASAW